MTERGLHMVSNGRSVGDVMTYRPYTRALLRRYMRMAVDLGRLPNVLGGLCFRARISAYRLHTFEDTVIFVHDIERAFDRMERQHMEIIAGVILLDYSIPEAALRLGISVQRAERRYAAAVDTLSAILLESGLLRPISGPVQEEADDPDICADALPPRKPPQPAHTDRDTLFQQDRPIAKR